MSLVGALLVGSAVAAAPWGCVSVSIQGSAQLYSERDGHGATDDAAVFDTVLADLLRWAVFDNPFGHDSIREKIVVHSASRPQTPTLKQRRIHSDTQRRVLPRDAYKNLLKRNVRPVSLTDYHPTDSRIIIDDASSVISSRRYMSVTVFSQRYPDAKGFVHLWRPGYSKDGSSALVRLRIAKSKKREGAVVTYLLVKDEETWRVDWRMVSDCTEPIG